MTAPEAIAAAEGVIARVMRWAALRSISREEHALAERVAREMQVLGVAVQRRDNNVWCEFGDRPRPRLLLNSHLDTVPPASGWTGDPWSIRQERDRIIGLGVNDAKGCGAALFEAVFRLRQEQQRGRALHGTIIFALTAEEEISGNGLSAILEQLRPLDAAIVGEPTGLTPMIAQRGLLVLRCVASGRTSHPANTPADTPHNAIQNAANDIARLRDVNWGPPHPMLGETHAHVTMISGGVARNVIPDACEFWVDIRTTPAVSHAELVQRIRAALRCEVYVHSERLMPMETGAHEPIVQAATAATGLSPRGSPTMSDMVFLRGTPSVKIGPGESARSHTPDEFILPHELEQGANVYERLVRDYFSRSEGGQNT